MTNPSGKRNKENLPLESYSITNENGFIPQTIQFEKGGSMFLADKSMYRIVEPNTFGYNPARINVGSIGFYDGNKNIIVSSLYELFQTKDKLNSCFLSQWFKTEIFQHAIEVLQEGGVRLYYYYDKLCQTSIEIPSLDEQKRIGGFLSSFDTLLTLRQREHLIPFFIPP